jgi:hypothetical protein
MLENVNITNVSRIFANFQKYVIFAEVRKTKVFIFNPIVTGGAGTCFRISQEVLFEHLTDGCTADAVAGGWGRLFLTDNRRLY